MATIHLRHQAILKNLVEAGFTDEKKICSIGLSEAAKLPRCCRIDLISVLECIQAVKSNKLLSYLVDETSEPPKQENEDET